jgi:hypothetical protein
MVLIKQLKPVPNISKDVVLKEYYSMNTLVETNTNFCNMSQVCLGHKKLRLILKYVTDLKGNNK